MSYRHGETNWQDKMTPDEIEMNHRKPFVPQVGGLLAEAAAVLTLLPPAPCLVIDAGCADGHLSHLMSLAGYQVVGIDVCKSEIDWAGNSEVNWRGLKSSPCFLVADFDNFPPDREGLESMANAIVFTGALHHSVNRRITLQSAFNALRPGGRLIASEPGLGHGWTKVSQDWSKKFDVTERSCPPYSIAWDGWKVGFRGIKVYPMPVTLHNATYNSRRCQSDNRIASIIKAIPLNALLLHGLKWLHGITVMEKPK